MLRAGDHPPDWRLSKVWDTIRAKLKRGWNVMYPTVTLRNLAYTELILNKERHKQSVDLKAWAAYPTKSEKHPNGRYTLKWQARNNRVFFFYKTNKQRVRVFKNRQVSTEVNVIWLTVFDVFSCKVGRQLRSLSLSLSQQLPLRLRWVQLGRYGHLLSDRLT